MQLKRNAVSVMPGKRYLLDTNALIALLQIEYYSLLW